jgi:hypothetical protein
VPKVAARHKPFTNRWPQRHAQDDEYSLEQSKHKALTKRLTKIQSFLLDSMRSAPLLHPSIQVYHDIHHGDQNLHRNQHNDNPLQLLPMPMTQLILQHSQQIRNDVQSLRQQTDPLIHLQIASDGLIHGLELRLDPEELGRVEHRAVEVDVDAQNEELADLHVDLGACEGDGAGEGDLGGDVLAGFDGVVDEGFEEGGLDSMQYKYVDQLTMKLSRGYLDALSQGVGDGQFRHVVVLLAQGDEVVVYSCLVLARIVEVEAFRLHVVFRKLLILELRYLLQKALLVAEGHAPYHHDAVVEEKHFGCMHLCIKVGRVLADTVLVLDSPLNDFRLVAIPFSSLPIIQAHVSAIRVENNKVFPSMPVIVVHLNGAI